MLIHLPFLFSKILTAPNAFLGPEMDQNANKANCCCLKKTGLETYSVAGPLPGGCKTGRSKYPLN